MSMTEEMEEPTMEDLFGEGDDVGGDEVVDGGGAGGGGAPEGYTPKSLPGRTILRLPALPRLSAKGDFVSLLRVPHFLGVARRAYDPERAEAAAEEAAELAAMDKPLAADALIRHVVSASGVRASNARIVEWADGSMTLHVGDDLFSLRKAAGSAHGARSTGAGAGAGADKEELVADRDPLVTFIYSKSVSLPDNAADAALGAAAARRESVLEAHAAVDVRLVAGALRVEAAGAAALAAKITASRAAKRARTGEEVVITNFEAEKAERIKLEEAAARADASLARRTQEASRGGGGSRRGAGGVAGSSAMAADNDSDVDGEGISLKRIKAKANRGGKAAAPKKVGKKKRSRDNDDSSEAGTSGDEEEEEEEESEEEEEE